MRRYEMPEAKGLNSWVMVKRDVPKPGPRQVLVKLKAASINFRDLLIVKKLYGIGGPPADLVPLSDAAGEVVEVGEGVSRFASGERVIGAFFTSWFSGTQKKNQRTALGGDVDGVLAEYRVFDEGGLVACPAHLSWEEAATLPCAGLTAWNGLYGLKPILAGDTLLALGTGGVSTFAIQFAHAAGARVIATSSSDEKLEKVKALGATDGINYKVHENWNTEARKLTGGEGVDHILEVGGAETLPRSLKSVKTDGVISIIGMVAGGSKIDPLSILAATAVVRGLTVGSRDMFEAMNRSISINRIKPVVDRVFAFEEANDALTYFAGRSHTGKVVIRIE